MKCLYCGNMLVPSPPTTEGELSDQAKIDEILRRTGLPPVPRQGPFTDLASIAAKLTAIEARVAHWAPWMEKHVEEMEACLSLAKRLDDFLSKMGHPK
jgi:hypothetical protein